MKSLLLIVNWLHISDQCIRDRNSEGIASLTATSSDGILHHRILGVAITRTTVPSYSLDMWQGILKVLYQYLGLHVVQSPWQRGPALGYGLGQFDRNIFSKNRGVRNLKTLSQFDRMTQTCREGEE